MKTHEKFNYELVQYKPNNLWIYLQSTTGSEGAFWWLAKGGDSDLLSLNWKVFEVT